MSQKSLIGDWLMGLQPDLREEFEERAGIMEFEGGLSRECAEYAAMAVLFRGNPLGVMGLHLASIGPSRYLLTNDPARLGSLGVVASGAINLPAVIAELGGAVVLEAPKTEIPDVSKVRVS